MSEPNHFIDLDRFDKNTLRRILDLGVAFKHGKKITGGDRPLEGKTLAMVFEKPSTRTRVSFQVAMQQLGGQTVLLGGHDSQLARGESIADTARVLSRYVDAIMIRTDAHEKVFEIAAHADVPVINGLTDWSHPCQLMADILTFEERKGPITGRTVAWCGAGNNVATSWVHAAVRFEFTLRLACPDGLRPRPELVSWATELGADIRLAETAAEAAAGADAVVTDTWVSMGENDAGARRNKLLPYRVDEALMAKADPDAVFLHCLPAHRGEEVTAGVIDGPQSVVWDEAENRLHVQKGILAWCMT